MSEQSPRTSPTALYNAIQRLHAQLQDLEVQVSTIAGGGGGGDSFDDTTGVTTLTGARGWDGAGTHNVTVAGAEATLRGDTNVKIVTPGVLATTLVTGYVFTLTDPLTGAGEFQEVPAPSGSFLPLSGGTMSGAINMGSQKINTLATPTANSDATTKLYVDQRDGVIETVNFDSGAVVSGVVNDLNFGSTTANRVAYYFSTAGVPLTLTGIIAPTHNNRILYFVNTSARSIQLAFSDTRSISANRILGGMGITTIGYLETVVFHYRTDTAKWYPIWKIPSPLAVRHEVTSAGSYLGSGGTLQDAGAFSFLRNSYGNNLVVIASSGQCSTLTQILELFNVSGGSVIIEHEGAPPLSFTVADLVNTPTGANVTWPHLTLARFAYDHVALRWRLLNTPA